MIKLLSAFLIASLPLILVGEVFAATLSLSPASGTINRSCNFSLEVVLDTQGADTFGTDAILIYDNARFTAQTISEGTIYSEYPGNTIEDDKGKVTISGLASATDSFSGKGTLATVNFMVKDQAQTGAAQIKFDFDPNDRAKSTDSNVGDKATVTDVLSAVTNGSFTIGSGSCSAQTTQPTVSTGSGKPVGAVVTPTPSEKTLPPAGSGELTLLIAAAGVVLTIIGILGLALL